jgi:tetratricopeptide (TPR) repeat protein
MRPSLKARNSGANDSPARWKHWLLLGGVCVLVIGFFDWSAQSSYRSLDHPLAKDSDYNLLMQSLRAGQLNLPLEVPPELAAAANPYDKAADRPYIRNVYDMSYYHGKIYIYFGVTPVLTLYWPYWALTGLYLPDKGAVVTFYTVGFLAAAWLLYSVWRRCFSAAGISFVAAGMASMGLALGLTEMTSYSCDVNEVAPVCGFAFSMLALAGIWRSMSEPRGKFKWLSLASLALGLAMGARPTWVFGTIALLAPVAQAWRSAADRNARRRAAWLLTAAIGPVTFVGLGLMLYNFLRFDNPFEFGIKYQLTHYPSNHLPLFSVHHFWFVFQYYFLGWMRWCDYCPFLQLLPSLPVPADAYGTGSSYGGILALSPIVWLAPVALWAWRSSRQAAGSALGWLLIVIGLLFILEMSTLCCYFAGYGRFELEFLPALLLLSLVGLLALVSAPVGATWRRYVVHVLCWLLLAGSIVFNLLAMAAAHAQANFYTGNWLVNNGRAGEAVSYFRAALAVEPGSGPFHYCYGNSLYRTGHFDEALFQYQRAVQIQPNYVEAHNDLALVLLQVGRLNDAIGHLQTAAEIQPTGAAYVKLGGALASAGRLEEAAVQLQKAVQIQPNYVEAHHDLGLVLLQLGQVSDAIGQFQIVVQTQPTGEAYYNLGYAYRKNRMAAEAVASLQKALELQPGFEVAQVVLAWTLATWPEPSIRNGAKAVAWAEQASEGNGSQNPQVLRVLAAAYAETGRFAEAESAAQHALALAAAQGNAQLTNALPAEIKLYQAGSPCRSTED